MNNKCIEFLYEHYNNHTPFEQIQQEGFIRGLGSEFEDVIDSFAVILDLGHLNDLSVIPRVKDILNKARKVLQKNEFTNAPGSSNMLLKFRQGWSTWRFFYFLNDNFFKKCVDYVKKTGKDPIGWININFNERIIPEMYNAKSSDDLIKILDKYEKKLEYVYLMKKKYPDQPGWGPFLRQGLYGARDLVISIRKLVTYNS